VDREPSIKVAVIDRHGFYIDAVMTILSTQPDLEVVEGATIFEDYVESANGADVIILQQETNPLTRELLRDLHSELPEAKLVVLGAPADDEVIISYIECGAIGYVRENEEIDELLNVIRVVCAGEALAHPSLIAPLYRRLSEISRNLSELFPSDVTDATLTERQQEVIELLVDGRSNAEIADSLNISIGTVKNHVHKIFDRLGVHSRDQAALVYSQLTDGAKDTASTGGQKD
jgi:DNA-binding NarL/FixJ family response regulator